MNQILLPIEGVLKESALNGSDSNDLRTKIVIFLGSHKVLRSLSGVEGLLQDAVRILAKGNASILPELVLSTIEGKIEDVDVEYETALKEGLISIVKPREGLVSLLSLLGQDRGVRLIRLIYFKAGTMSSCLISSTLIMLFENKELPPWMATEWARLASTKAREALEGFFESIIPSLSTRHEISLLRDIARKEPAFLHALADSPTPITSLLRGPGALERGIYGLLSILPPSKCPLGQYAKLSSLSIQFFALLHAQSVEESKGMEATSRKEGGAVNSDGGLSHANLTIEIEACKAAILTQVSPTSELHLVQLLSLLVELSSTPIGTIVTGAPAKAQNDAVKKMKRSTLGAALDALCVPSNRCRDAKGKVHYKGTQRNAALLSTTSLLGEGVSDGAVEWRRETGKHSKLLIDMSPCIYIP